MPNKVYTHNGMEMLKIYQCLCDRTRLRLLNLLADGELCVCHLQTILGEPQVKVSKHLAYLRRHGLVEARKEANWMIYRLPAKRSRELAANLACLQDCGRENPIFTRDRVKREACAGRMAKNSPICCPRKQLR
jgi:ArsR family transcriptional regulator, arsenate/arsenite/antimonite-responsive transcriptional repressor